MATEKRNGGSRPSGQGRQTSAGRPAGKTQASAPSAAAVKAPPRRRRRRYPTAASRLLVLFVVLGAVAGMMYMLLRLMGGAGQAQTAAAVPTASPRPSPTAAPTATPVPTPALPAVDVNSWELRLVRYEYPLGEDYRPQDLTDIGDGQQMDSRVAPKMLQLLEDARAAGNPVWVCSGYRSYDTQYIIYQRHIDQYTAEGMTMEEADAKTRLAVNYPGSSEHQYGLSADIMESSDQPMEPYIGGSGLMLWLEEHCAEYGFVIRYPDGKTPVTGVEYEPWHLRYVGEEAARYIMEHGLCLEEFLDLYQF